MFIGVDECIRRDGSISFGYSPLTNGILFPIDLPIRSLLEINYPLPTPLPWGGGEVGATKGGNYMDMDYFDATSAIVWELSVREQERIQKEDPILWKLVNGIPWWQLAIWNPMEMVNEALVKYRAMQRD